MTLTPTPTQGFESRAPWSFLSPPLLTLGVGKRDQERSRCDFHGKCRLIVLIQCGVHVVCARDALASLSSPIRKMRR